MHSSSGIPQGLTSTSCLLTLMPKAAGKPESCAKTVLESDCLNHKAMAASGVREEHSTLL